jgi:hypothetical protein
MIIVASIGLITGLMFLVGKGLDYLYGDPVDGEEDGSNGSGSGSDGEMEESGYPSGFVRFYKYVNQWKMKDNHRWVLLHSILNLFIVCLTFDDMCTFLGSNNTIQVYRNVPHSIVPSLMVMSLHLYHVLCYKLRSTDIIAHHLIMMLILSIPIINRHNNYFVMFCNYALFFLSGLPGGVDYFCMHLYYLGKIKKDTEKVINVYLNSYLRAPAILYGAFLIHRDWVNGELAYYYPLLVIPSFVWNAQHFSKAVSISYGQSLARNDREAPRHP